MTNAQFSSSVWENQAGDFDSGADLLVQRVDRARRSSMVREAYVSAARTAATLLAHPAVGAWWDRPSALPHYAVSGLAGHLAGQIFFAEKALAAPLPQDDPIPILDYYERVSWRREDHDSPTHVRIRAGSVRLAEDGAAALAARAAEAADRLPALLTTTPQDRCVRLPAWEWTLTFDDFLFTRLVELVVHVDDLAVSTDLATPTMPPEITDPVLTLLFRLATRTHGVIPLLRSLTRVERAPTHIAVF